MRASSRLTCIQRFDPPRASLLLSLSLYSLYLSPPPHLSWSLPPLPQRQPEIKTGFHFPLHSSLVSFFFLPSSSSSSFFFLSSHFFLFLDHYNTVRRIPVPAWLNPIIYSFLRVVAHKWVVLGLVLLYNRMRRVRLSIRPGRINEKVNERFRIATRYPFSVSLYLSILVSVRRIRVPWLRSICCSLFQTTLHVEFLFFPRLLRPRKSNYFPLDPLALFFFRANLEHPRLLCELKPGSTYRKTTIFPRRFEIEISS